MIQASDLDGSWPPPSLEVFQAHPTGRRPRKRPRNLLEGLFIPSGLGMPWDTPNKMEDVTKERDFWGSLLDMLSQISNKWTDVDNDLYLFIRDIEDSADLKKLLSMLGSFPHVAHTD